MYAGKEITIEGEKYTLPPISLGQLRNGLAEKFKLHDELVGEGSYWEFMTLRGEIILSAFKRNYPDFVDSKFMDYLDLSNIGEAWLFILGASGLISGETPAAKVTETGTLDQSTALSPQPTDGLIEK